MTTLLQIIAEQSALDRFLLPKPASNLARDVDWAWNFVFGVTTFFFVVVVGIMTYFVIKYRRRGPAEQTPTITHNTPLEIMWTGIPLVLVIAIFFIGFKGFVNYDTPRSDSRRVQVEASKWTFDFTYPNGSVDKNLYLELNVPTVLDMTSRDVLHGVYIPAFRTQRNAIYGRTTQIWFIPEMLSPPPLGSDPGGFPLFCTQYCGQNHSTMHTRVHVLKKEDYDRKMVELANPFKDSATNKWIPYVQVGEKLYTQSCMSCHSTPDPKNPSALRGGDIGPSLKGMWKRNVEWSYSNAPGFTLSSGDPDGKWIEYLRESMLDPQAKIVKGYSGSMPAQPQFGGTEVNEEKFRAMVEFIKSVGSGPYNPKVSPAKNPELFNVDAAHPVHPQSKAAEKASATQQK